jgi:DnaJ-class molecular chaperone
MRCCVLRWCADTRLARQTEPRFPQPHGVKRFVIAIRHRPYGPVPEGKKAEERTMKIICPGCGGTGALIKTCPDCGGRMWRTETITTTEGFEGNARTYTVTRNVRCTNPDCLIFNGRWSVGDCRSCRGFGQVYATLASVTCDICKGFRRITVRLPGTTVSGKTREEIRDCPNCGATGLVRGYEYQPASS